MKTTTFTPPTTRRKLLLTLAALLLTALTASADEITYPVDLKLGTGNTDSEKSYVKGRLNADGTLYIWDTGRVNTVPGTSEMKGATGDASTAIGVWYDSSTAKNYSSYIKNVIFLAAGQQPNADGTGTEAASTSASIKYTGVTSIGKYSFAACTNLESVDLSACTNTTRIGESAFEKLTKLTTVKLPGTLKDDINTKYAIGSSAFYQCTALTSVTFAANTLTGDETMTIGESAFNGCTALTSIDLSPCTKLTKILKNAFRGCSAVHYVKLPSSIVNGPYEGTDVAIGSYAFSNCTGTLDLSDATLDDNSKITFLYNTTSSVHNFNRNSGILDGGRFSASIFVYLPKAYTGTKPKNGTWDTEYNIAYWDGSKWVCPKFQPSTAATAAIDLKYPFTAEKVKYDRGTLTASTAYTVCLPWKPQTTRYGSAIDVTYYKLSAVSGTTITFSEVATDDLAANTPYLLVTGSSWSGVYSIDGTYTDGQNIEIPATPSDLSVTADGYKMVGTLQQLSAADTEGKYILQAGAKWQKKTAENASVYVPALRAYIVETTGGAGAPALNSTFGGDDNSGTTAIENIRTVSADGSEHYYDLQGRPLTAPKRGINIVNGKKVVIK